jgi:N-methylhydantoinase B
LRGERGEGNQIFNFGPDIETLRATCLAETGLPAPQQPVWPLAIAAE